MRNCVSEASDKTGLQTFFQMGVVVGGKQLAIGAFHTAHLIGFEPKDAIDLTAKSTKEPIDSTVDKLKDEEKRHIDRNHLLLDAIDLRMLKNVLGQDIGQDKVKEADSVFSMMASQLFVMHQ